MPTTTLKLPPILKKQVASIVRGTDKSAHAFMVEAIAKHADSAMRRKAFVADALAAEREMERTGLAFDFDDVRTYLNAKIAGKPARRPRLKRWSK